MYSLPLTRNIGQQLVVWFIFLFDQELIPYRYSLILLFLLLRRSSLKKAKAQSSQIGAG